MRTIITLVPMVLLISGVLASMVNGAVALAASGANGAMALPSSDPPPDLVVNGENPWVSKVFEVECVIPGDSGEATLELQNIGDPGTLELHLLNLVDGPGITPEPEPTPDLGEFSQNLDMLIWFDDGDNLYEAGEVKIAEDTLNNIACNVYPLGTLGYMEITYIGIAWSVDKGVGNEIMGDFCTFDIQFVIH